MQVQALGQGLSGRGEGEEGDREEETPGPVIFRERWITGLLFWSATTELYAEVTFERVKGVVSIFAKKECSLLFKEKSLLSWRATMSCMHDWSLQASLFSYQH